MPNCQSSLDYSTIPQVRTLGGEVNGEGTHVDGAPRLQVGEKVILFGRKARTRVRSIGLSQGVFRVEGRQAVRDWIVPLMAEYGELYTAYEWHSVDANLGKVMVYMQNRRDHPSGEGTIDFPGITILDYAGDGLWSQEEDYWALPLARRAQKEYDQAREKFDPEHAAKRTRHHWGNGPDWTRGARTWFDRP